MRILTINVGSSSLRAVLYRMESPETVEARATAVRLGSPRGCLRVVDGEGAVLLDGLDGLASHTAALDALFTLLQGLGLDEGLCAIGQRVVHGGGEYSAPTLITEKVLSALRL